MFDREFTEKVRQKAIEDGKRLGYKGENLEWFVKSYETEYKKGYAESQAQVYKEFYEANLHAAAKLVVANKLSRTEAAKAFKVKRNDLKKAIEDLS